MDALFSRAVSADYVSAFASRLVLGMGKGLQRAGDALKGSLEAEFEGLWTLAMVVVQWYAELLPKAEAQAVTTALLEFDLSSTASNLSLFRERLLPFVKTAHEADGEAQLAAAGVYFVAAVQAIGVKLLSTALHSTQLGSKQVQILARLPPPADIKASYLRIIGSSGTLPAQVMQKQPKPGASRAERFDHADFDQRRTISRGQVKTGRALEPTSAARPPTPNLDGATIARAYLFTVGWEGAEVERLVAGPSGPSQPETEVSRNRRRG